MHFKSGWLKTRFFMHFGPASNIIKVLYRFLKRVFGATFGRLKNKLNFASPQNPFGMEILNGFYWFSQIWQSKIKVRISLWVAVCSFKCLSGTAKFGSKLEKVIFQYASYAIFNANTPWQQSLVWGQLILLRMGCNQEAIWATPSETPR